jgi:vanadium chloroperoxidase
MNDPILFWNAVAIEANRIDHTESSAEPRRGPTDSSRAAALVHLAMHDAYFGVAGVSTIPGPGPKRAWLIAPPAWTGGDSPQRRSSAVAGAAASMLSTLYSGQRTWIETKLAEFAAADGVDDGAFRFGQRVAEAVLQTRIDEVTSADADHVASPARGRHRVDPYNADQGYLGVHYGRNPTLAVTTFHNQAPPPAIGTQLYGKHYKEVLENGAKVAAKRTPEETMIGLYWAYDGASGLGTPPRLYNQVVREIAIGRNNTPEQNARLFALANCAMGDAGIHAWHWKYAYDVWRPVIGIREQDPSCGPAGTADKAITPPADPYWRPLGAPRSNTRQPEFTPPFPAYPSGHATFCAAALEVVRLFYGHVDAGTKDTIGFTFVSDEHNGATTDQDGAPRTRHARRYDSVAAAIYDNSVSRVYLGVHWRFDGTTGESVQAMLTASDNIGGVPLGRAIARDIVTSGMQQQPMPPRAPAN